MNAKQVAWIPTAHAVYTVAYGADGRLWYGGGFFYGGGFVGRVELDGEAHLFDDAHWRAVAVSGLCLDGDERHLALSTWGSNHAHPALVVQLDGGVPGAALKYSLRGERRTPTGVLLHEGHLVVRSNGGLEQTLDMFPAGDAATPGGLHPALASRRVVGIEGAVVTGYRNGLLYRELGEDGFGVPRVIECASTVARAVGWGRGVDPKRAVTLGVREPSEGRVTAMSIDLRGTQITTGHDDGAIARWRVGRDADGQREIKFVEKSAGHRFPVAASCRLGAGAMELPVDRGGAVKLWEAGRRVAEWQLEDGSPRAIASDVTGRRVAVGCKHVEGGPNPGGIAIFELG
jgi:hypothetical protein